MIESLADFDEALMEKYLGGEQPTEDEIKAAIRKGTIALKMLPVVCGSSFKNKGVQTLLDSVIDYLPSPVEIPPMLGHSGQDPEKEIICFPDPNEPFAALALGLQCKIVGISSLLHGANQ